MSPGIRAEAGRGRKIERGEDEIFISRKTGVCLFHVPRTQEAFPHFLLFFSSLQSSKLLRAANKMEVVVRLVPSLSGEGGRRNSC